MGENSINAQKIEDNQEEVSSPPKAENPMKLIETVKPMVKIEFAENQSKNTNEKNSDD